MPHVLEKKEVSEDEKFYDEKIAPLLMQISEWCQSKGFAFVSAVEFTPGEIGTTAWLPTPPSLPMVMLNHCAKTGDNIDGYVLGLLKFCKENGIDYSRSMVMSRVDGPQIILP